MAAAVAIRLFAAEKIKLFLTISLVLILGTLLSIFYNQRNYGINEEIVEQFIKSQEELYALKIHFSQLQDLLLKEKYKTPKPEYEKLRRRIANTIQEFWSFINSEINYIKKEKKSDDIIETLDKVISAGVQYKRSMVLDVEKISQVDGFNEWRIKEINNLSDIIQDRLSYLQNPVDCENAKKLVCQINYFCGFGCQMHHLISCMTLAYGTQRTLILKSINWQYHKAGWEGVFKSLSKLCTYVNDTIAVTYPGNKNSLVIDLPPKTQIHPRSKYLPLAIPEDLSYRLATVHGNPSAWWIGQILKYVWKPQNVTMSHINHKIAQLQLGNSYVAVHIRRTDKIRSEARFQSVEKYMAKVEEYFNETLVDTNVAKRKVYIATDDFNAITEAKAKYPHYDIIHNPDVPNNPRPDFLHSKDNIISVILDIHIMSHSHYLVCTFSSNICRLAYELMQIYHVDASAKIASLDDIYFYSQENTNQRVTITSHKAQSAQEIDLLPGDIVHITYNYWNGYSKGKNLRTRKHGLFPSFKVDMGMETVKFPTYSEIYT
ncbi:hypothetical protein FQR65_LT10854 [Abscondita terminalis]|nr:hypothetical protein FQR65_LT10854 [Abscondita terminalis]